MRERILSIVGPKTCSTKLRAEGEASFGIGRRRNDFSAERQARILVGEQGAGCMSCIVPALITDIQTVS